MNTDLKTLTRGECRQLIEDCAGDLAQLLQLWHHWTAPDRKAGRPDADAEPDLEDAEDLESVLYEYADAATCSDDTRRRGYDDSDDTGLTEPPTFGHITPEALAAEFSRQLRIELGSDEISQVTARNEVEFHAMVCHSHDFCDANMVMQAAISSLTPCEPDSVPAGAAMDDALLALWNAAWAIAKASRFAV